MDNTIPFTIKNYRLIPTKQTQKLNSKNPLQNTQISIDPVTEPNAFIFKQKKYELSESFGTTYIGTDVITVGQVVWNANPGQILEYVNIEFTVQLEKKKDLVVANQFQLKNVDCKSIIRCPTEIKLEIQDNYIFIYKFTYKEKPFVIGTTQQQQEQTWQKKFRVQPSLPFEIQAPKIYRSLAPTYLIEYTFVNICGEKLVINDLKFQTESPFESVKVTSPSSENQSIQLLNQETENIIFKISVKPDQLQTYQNLLKNINHEIEKQVNLGSIMVQWGTCGTFVGNTVTLNIQSNDIIVEFAQDQKPLVIDTIQQVKVKIYSPTQKSIAFKVHLQDREMDNIKTIGSDISHFSLTPENPQQEITFFVVPTNAGIHQLKGIYFINVNSHSALIYKNNLYLTINSEEQDIAIKKQVQKQPSVQNNNQQEEELI